MKKRPATATADKLRKAAPAVVIIGVIVCFSLALPIIKTYGPYGWQGDDFVEFYAAGKLAGTPALYDAKAIHDVEAPYHPGMFSLPFLRPPFYAMALRPLSMLPYAAARWLWALAAIAAAVAAVPMWRVGPLHTRAVIAAWLLPIAFAIACGQDSVFVLLFAVLLARFLEEDRPAAAGCVLALCAIKYHLVAGIVIYLLVSRRWRTMLWAAGGVLVEIAISFLVQGPSWLADYLALLRVPGSDLGVRAMPTLRGILSRLPATDVLEIVAVAALLVLFGMMVRKLDVHTGIAMALVVGVLVGRHAYTYDLVLLFPLIAGAVHSRGFRYIPAAVLLAPPLYLLPWMAGMNELSFFVSQLAILAAMLRMLRP